MGIYHVNFAVQSNKQFNKDSVLFRYKLAPYVTINGFKYFTTYLKSIDDDKKIYIFGPLAYGFKIESGLKINKYDLVNDGNMGYMGDYIYLNEIKNDCNNKKCVFIINYIDRLYADKKSQTSRSMMDYVVNNCNLVNKTYIFGIYEN